MERQRNNPQLKGKEESSGRMISEIEASKLLDIKFKTMVIRKLNELSENYTYMKININDQQEPRGNK